MRTFSNVVILVGACIGCTGVGERDGTGLPDGDEVEDGVLRASQLQGTQLQGTQLQGTQLQGTQLQGTQLQGMTLEGAALTGARVEAGELVAERPLDVTGTTASLTACTSSTHGLTRSCGWSSIDVGSCTPHAEIDVGAGSGCGLGSCTGDPMLRVCSGTTPCEWGAVVSPEASSGMLGTANGGCGGGCPKVTFTCPASGVYNVMAGSYHSQHVSSVVLAADSGGFPAEDEELRGEDLVGVAFTARGVDPSTSPPTEHVIPFRITAVEEEDPAYDPLGSGSTWLYTIEHQVPDTGAWVNACGEDHDHRRAAIPIAATWDDRGDRHESTDEFTFACTTGVLAKCYRWGYRPWVTFNGDPDLMADMHWSCTRMARADYCGDGVSHTLNGTVINMWDTLPAPGPVQSRGTTPTGMSFEAGWSTHGAVCLSHARWSSLAPLQLASCEDRLIPPGGTGEATCDTAAEAFGEDPDTLLLNESYLGL